MTIDEIRRTAQAVLVPGYSAGELFPAGGGRYAGEVRKDDEPDWLEFGFPMLTVHGCTGRVEWLSFKTGEPMANPFGGGLMFLLYFLFKILRPSVWLRWPWQSKAGLAWPIVFILALGYRPGHPWSGLEALGICLLIVVTLRAIGRISRGN